MNISVNSKELPCKISDSGPRHNYIQLPFRQTESNTFVQHIFNLFDNESKCATDLVSTEIFARLESISESSQGVNW